MQIQIADNDRILRICRHEAGHYVLAREMGFNTNGIGVEFQVFRGHKGEAQLEPWFPNIESLAAMEDALERRIKVLYAGVIAESVVEEQYDSDYALNEWENGGGQMDHAKIRELTHVLRNVKYPKTTDQAIIQTELDSISDALFRQTGDLVGTRFDLISGIAESMRRKIKEYNTFYRLEEEEINNIQSIRELYSDKKA